MDSHLDAAMDLADRAWGGDIPPIPPGRFSPERLKEMIETTEELMKTMSDSKYRQFLIKITERMYEEVARMKSENDRTAPPTDTAV